MEITLAGLRVLRETAERGTFTAAADALGYTQSAVSRQIAMLERAVGAPLFDRGHGGLRLTRQGHLLLRRARTAIEEIDQGAREVRGVESGGRVRIGAVLSAGPVLLPRVLAALRRTRPDLSVPSRTGTTPALVRGLRAGTVDIALVISRPPHRPLDDASPRLSTVALLEMPLCVAVAGDSPLASRDVLDPEELVDQVWITSTSTGDEPQLGVWPGLPGRPRAVHVTNDWSTKLQLVASRAGITTVSPIIVPALPAGVRIVPVSTGTTEIRRLVAAVRPEGDQDLLRDVLAVIDAVATGLAEEVRVDRR